VSQPSSSLLATLVAHRLSKSHGAVPVLVDVDLTVGPSQRVGVIGPNGVGKTTLLRILAGLDSPDSGWVLLTPNTASVGYLAQEHPSDASESLREMLARRSGVAAAEAGLEKAAAALAEGLEGSEEAYSLALERFMGLGAGDFEARLEQVMGELSLSPDTLELPTAALSGGQRAKAHLASLLLSRFDLLLLDEPTNDLDFAGLESLERFLGRRPGGIVIVSHDRAFLERTVTSVLEIDEWTHQATVYNGSFSAYRDAREIARRQAEEAYESYVSERERLQKREREQRQWAVQGVRRETRNPRDNDKAQRDFRINRTEKQASKVKITEKALERLEVVERPFQPWQLQLELPSSSRSGDVVAEFDGVVVRRGSWQLGPLDLLISWGERLALLGPNGSGKSTLIAALLGRLEPEVGRLRLGSSVVVGELGQERRRFYGTSPLGEVFIAASGAKLSEARSLLAKFGLGADHAGRRADSLSPGERTRAELALLMARGTNCLVLDEPTNHLDLPAIEQLEAALSSWGATFVLVTHDRALLSTVRLSREVRVENGAVVSDRTL
jgi:ATPase subunit of ABC transporter with duplicated ATPase domains